MRQTIYLIVNQKKVLRMSKTRSGAPSVQNGEYAIKLNVEVPDAAFRRFIPEATVVVPEKGLIPPAPIVTVSTPPEAQG